MDAMAQLSRSCLCRCTIRLAYRNLLTPVRSPLKWYVILAFLLISCLIDLSFKSFLYEYEKEKDKRRNVLKWKSLARVSSTWLARQSYLSAMKCRCNEYSQSVNENVSVTKAGGRTMPRNCIAFEREIPQESFPRRT